MKSEIARILMKEPRLTEYGMETTDLTTQKYWINRKDLLYDTEEFEACCKFIKKCKLLSTVNCALTSYHWKHKVEKQANIYIPNGIFIAAAIHMDVPYEVSGDGPNVFLALEEGQLVV